MSFDPSTSANLATAIAGWVGLLLSIPGLIFSLKALRLAEQQEQRRKPLLSPYLMDGYVRTDPGNGNRVYAFLLSISNPTDSDNSVAGVDLRVTYKTREGVALTVKVRSDSELQRDFENRSGVPLPAPARVDAHQTILGWCFFQIHRAILEGAIIEDYLVVLIDSHGIEVSVKPIVVREYGDEIEASSEVAAPPPRS
jgi:hypothetical protein